MAYPKATNQTKTCETCGNTFQRRRWANGQLDAHWKYQRFCGRRCAGLAQGMTDPKSGRKAAQKLVQLVFCEKCGGTTRLQRHHLDGEMTNNALTNIKVLCQTCHTAAHMETGTWGKAGGQRSPRLAD